MSNELYTLSFQILDKTWQIRCQESRTHDLQKCAVLFDNKMREIVNSGKVMGMERVAVMAAINALYELISQQNQKDLYIESLSSHIRELQAQLAKAKAEMA